MEAFFTTEEQRTQYYKNAKKDATRTIMFGGSLMVGGIILYLISVKTTINRNEYGALAGSLGGLFTMTCGLIVIDLSSVPKRRADFWASTLE